MKNVVPARFLPLFIVPGFRAELENKIMTNSALSVGSNRESVCLSIAENDSSTEQRERHRSKFGLQYVINSLIALLVLTCLALIEFDVIPTTKSGYYCHDPRLSHPFNGDTISATALILGSFLGPILLLAAVEFKKTKVKYSLRVMWKWYKEMLIGAFSVLLVTEIMKAIVGAQRPHFLKTCQPDSELSCVNGTFVYEYSCMNDRYSFYVVGDSSRSFPSGHTALSVMVSIYCALFVHYRFLTRRYGQLLKHFIIVVCLTWGTVCGLTRVTDRRHHPMDVLAGALFGFAGALYALVLAKYFEVVVKDRRSPKLSPSTTALIDKQNKDATSVII